MAEKGFDRSMFMDKFKEETNEHIQKLNKCLLSFESDPENMDVMDELGREVHTLKGSAKMMGFNEIAEITHKMEDVFEALKGKKIKLNEDVTDALFNSLDAIGNLMKAILKGDKHNVDVEGICNSFEKVIKKGKSSADLQKELKEEPKVIKERGKKIAKKEEQKEISEKVEKEAEKEEPKVIKKTEGNLLREDTIETIRVSTSKLDKLVNLMGEIVVAQIKSERYLLKMKELWMTAEEQVLLLEKTYNVDKIRGKDTDSKGLELIINEINNHNVKMRDRSFSLFKEYDENIRQTGLVIDGLQSGLMEIRMLPLSTVFDFFPRTVRDLAKEYNKEIKLEIKGAETELDKKMLEEIKDPLIHLIRNAVDHGIEPPAERLKLNKSALGKISLSASQEGDRVYIYIEDDGRGIDPNNLKEKALNKGFLDKSSFDKISDREAIYLIFESGFSTSPIITDISGRGIGMDVVKNKVEGLKGITLVESEVGKGTKFSLSLPLTLATTRVLIVEMSNKTIYAIPTTTIEGIERIFLKDIIYVEGREAMKKGRRVIPLVELRDLLGAPFKSKRNEVLFVVVLSYARQRVGLIVDKLIGEEEIVIKNLGDFLKKVKNISGTTLLGSGEIALVLNVSEIIYLASIMGKVKVSLGKKKEKSKPRVLIVEDSLTTRELERSIVKAAGYEVDVAVDGMEGMEKLKKKKFDLLIADVQMPRMNGLQLTEWVKGTEGHKNMPVIIITSLDSKEEKEEGIKVGADAYIVKSVFDQTTLLGTIERLIK